MAISKIILNGVTQMDLTADTVDADYLGQSKTAHGSDGEAITGTAVIDPNPTAEPNDVNFIDYDGTIRYSYTYAEAAALSALPALPTHTGLTAVQWNWTLQDIADQLAVDQIMPYWIGAVYETTSGATEIDISLPKVGFKRYFLCLAINGSATIDWGDGTVETKTGSGSETSYNHRYDTSLCGDYTIKIKEASGSTYDLRGDTSARWGFVRGTSTRYDEGYRSAVNAIRIGGGVHTLYNGCISYFKNLRYVTIPNTITSFNVQSLRNCTSLEAIVMPYQKGFGSSKFQNCAALRTVSFSKHDGQGSLGYGQDLFNGANSLTNITLADGLPSIGASAFASTFSLARISIPPSVTSIGASAFASSNVNYIYMLRTTPPTLSNTNAFNSTDLVKIYVPYSADHSILNAYKTASNWSTYSSKMEEIPQ